MFRDNILMASGKSYIDAERHSDRNSLEKYLLMQGIKNTFNDRYVKSVVFLRNTFAWINVSR